MDTTYYAFRVANLLIWSLKIKNCPILGLDNWQLRKMKSSLFMKISYEPDARYIQCHAILLSILNTGKIHDIFLLLSLSNVVNIYYEFSIMTNYIKMLFTSHLSLVCYLWNCYVLETKTNTFICLMVLLDAINSRILIYVIYAFQDMKVFQNIFGIAFNI